MGIKLGTLFNLRAFERFADAKAFEKRFADSEPGIVLARNLTQVDPKIFEKKFPELAFMNSGIGIDNTGGYAEQIQSLRLVDQGGFSSAGDASANKGKISLLGEDSFLNVIGREAFSTWTDDQIEQAKLQNVNLPQRYVATHNKIYQREIDEIGLVGKGKITSSLLSNALFTSSSAAGTVDTLTAQQQYDAIASLITDQRSAVNNTPEYMAVRVLMPVRVMNVLMATILNTANGSMTVWAALNNNFPDVTFAASFRADTVANGGGLASASATVAYNPNDEAMTMRIPVPLTIGEIIKVGSFDFKVDSKYRIGGLDILEASAGQILTGL